MSKSETAPVGGERRPLSRLAVVVAFPILFVRLITLPAWPLGANHDDSSHASFEYFFRHDFRFGVEVIQNIGPLGLFNYAATYTGDLIGPMWQIKLLASAAFTVVYILLGVWAAGLFASRIKQGLFLLLLFFCEFFFESQTYIVWALAATYLAHHRRERLVGLVVFAAAGALALVKHTHLAIWFGFGIAFLGDDLFSGRRRACLERFGAWICGLGLFWLAAGQSLEDLPDFFRGAFEFVQGYGGALSKPAKASVDWAGFGSLALTLTAIWLNARRSREAGRVGFALFLAGLTFVSFKHGFVRGDAHVLNYAYFILVFGFLLHEADVAPYFPTGRKKAALAAALSAGLALMAAKQTESALDVLEAGGVTLIAHAGSLLDWPETKTRLDAVLAENSRVNALPLTREIVGEASIDMFSWRPAFMFHNRLNYRPRPMAIPFAAYTPWIMEKNRRFVASDKAAEYVLVDVNPIDANYPGMDDSLALIEIITRYEPVLAERGKLLMRRKPGSHSPRASLLEDEVRLDFGAPHPIPDVGADLVVAQIEIDKTATGRVRGFIHRIPPPRLVLTLRSGASRAFDFSPTASRAGFIVSPAVVETGSVLGLYVNATKYGEQARRDVAAFAVEADPRVYRGPATVRLYRLQQR